MPDETPGDPPTLTKSRSDVQHDPWKSICSVSLTTIILLYNRDTVFKSYQITFCLAHTFCFEARKSKNISTTPYYKKKKYCSKYAWGNNYPINVWIHHCYNVTEWFIKRCIISFKWNFHGYRYQNLTKKILIRYIMSPSIIVNWNINYLTVYTYNLYCKNK